MQIARHVGTRDAFAVRGHALAKDKREARLSTAPQQQLSALPSSVSHRGDSPESMLYVFGCTCMVSLTYAATLDS